MLIRNLAGTARWCRRRATRGGGDRGAAPLELAVLWVLIVLLVFGAVQVATHFVARTVALQTAQLGASTARQYDSTIQDGQTRADQYLTSTGDWLVGANVDCGFLDDTAEVVVCTVTGQSLSIVPFLPAWQIEQVAHGTVERET
jgi:Flp pilus assembly protein TadG